MNSSQLLSFVTFAYGFAATFYVAAWVFKKTMPAKLAKWVAIIGIIANIAGFILRWKESYAIGYGHAPLSNMYESLVFLNLDEQVDNPDGQGKKDQRFVHVGKGCVTIPNGV